MQENSNPLAVLYGYRNNRDELSFVGRKGIITIFGKSRKIEKILRLCNGMSTARDIASQLLSIKPEETLELLSLCEMHGIVKDSRELYLGFHEDSANPAVFLHDIGASDVASIVMSQRLRERNGKIIRLPRPNTSNVLGVIRERRSVRQFKQGRISEKKLSGLLAATYSVGKNGHWSVPSGGALYPLDLYLIVPSDEQALHRGVYRWNPEKSEVILVSDKDPNVWLFRVFNAKALLENAAYILCVAANLKRPALKYANRGYRNTLLEVGHAAQNTYLYCAEQDIGVVEYVGFCEKALAYELGLQFPHEAVIATLILGIEDKNKKQTETNDQKMVEIAWQLRHALVGDSKPITKTVFWEPEVNGYIMPRWIAMAAYLPPYNQTKIAMKKRCSAFATGVTSSEAVIKCLAEGFERYAWEQYQNELAECAVNLGEPFLNPSNVVPYAPIQNKILKDIEPFSPHKEIEWVSGVRLVNGEKIWVPAELVFSPPKPSRNCRKLCYRSSSNGVAAHFDKKVATETALYELIERDAFSVMWYSKRRVYALPYHCLSNEIQERISRWKSFGYEVTMLDLTLDGPPVVLVIIWSHNKTPALCSGAGCSLTFRDATNKAFDEAEFMAMTWHRRKLKRNMDARDIESPDDHGLFYANPQNLTHAEWLLNPKEKEAAPKDFNGDLNRFEPIVVDITPKAHKCGLTVVRVLSEKLMPINFGYGSEHYGHHRMKALQLKWNREYPSVPHFFA